MTKGNCFAAESEERILTPQGEKQHELFDKVFLVVCTIRKTKET
jgi:hypothetical protein